MLLLLKIIRESILLALSELKANKLRTFLSLFGISIGIFCISSVFTIVDGLENKVSSSISKIGDNVIRIERWPWEFGGDYPWWKYYKRPVPTYRELQRIQERVVGAKGSAIGLNLKINTIQYQSNKLENFTTRAVSQDFPKIYELEFKTGRFFSSKESMSGENEVIIGSDIATELFTLNTDPLGKIIKLKNKPMKVIGVFKKEGEDILNNTFDNTVMIPFNYAKNLVDMNNRDMDAVIIVKAGDHVPIEELKLEIKSILRAERKLKPMQEDNFAMNQLSLLSNQLGVMFGVINIAGLLIGGFSVIVGGFGIANIMFVSVKERTNLIGIKKAIGAKSYFILIEFLTESVILCLLGGFIGLSIVFGMTLLANQIFDFNLTVSLSNVLQGVYISVGIGVISGFLPAYRAAQLDPVVAMRYK